jgi:hypothetical protein
MSIIERSEDPTWTVISAPASVCKKQATSTRPEASEVIEVVRRFALQATDRNPHLMS